MSGIRSDIQEKGVVGWFVDSDLPIIVATYLALCGLYALVGLFLGYPPASILSSLATLTFYMTIYAMASLALNLHWGYTGLFNIGIAGFMAVGVYTTIIVSSGAPQGATDVGGLGFPLFFGILAGIAAAGLVGLIVGLPALRLRADYFAIVTLAASEIIRLTINSGPLAEFTLFGQTVEFTLLGHTVEFTLLGQTVGTNAGSGVRHDLNPVESLLGRLAQPVYGTDTAGEGYDRLMTAAEGLLGEDPSFLVDSIAWGVLLLLVLFGMFWVVTRVGRSPFGRVLKAIRNDEDVANSLGKNTDAFKLKAFVLGCALMGLVGILWRLERGLIDPDLFLPRITFFIWIALIIGGVGSNTGSIIGGMAFVAFLWEGPRYLNRVINRAFELPDAPPTFGHALNATIDGEAFATLAYLFENIRSLQLVIMGIVLILLLQRRPEGFLGHRVEEAATIRLGTGPSRQEADG